MLCEEMGRSQVTPMVFNCSAPDTGNAEILAEHGTPEQRSPLARPAAGRHDPLLLLDDRARDLGLRPNRPRRARRAARRRVGDRRPQVVHLGLQRRRGGDRDGGHRPRRRPAQAGEHDLRPDRHAGLPWHPAGLGDGPRRRAGHWEVRYEGVRVPEDHLLGPRGAGFPIAQDRLGPGRIHHCMRAIGSAERAFELMCERAQRRESFGGKLADKQFVQDFVAKSRMEIDSARLMVLHAAWKMDTEGKREARQEISMVKVIAAQMHQEVRRPRDAGARRAGHVRRRAPVARLAPGPLAAHRRRARRGAQGQHRPARAEPLQARGAGAAAGPSELAAKS